MNANSQMNENMPSTIVPFSVSTSVPKQGLLRRFWSWLIGKPCEIGEQLKLNKLKSLEEPPSAAFTPLPRTQSGRLEAALQAKIKAGEFKYFASKNGLPSQDFYRVFLSDDDYIDLYGFMSPKGSTDEITRLLGTKQGEYLYKCAEDAHEAAYREKSEAALKRLGI